MIKPHVHRQLRVRTILTALAVAALVAGPLATSSSASPNSAAVASGSTAATATALVSKVDAAARALLPASIRSSGTVTVASSIGFAPFEIYEANNKTPEGLDIDLIHAIEPVLGVKFDISDVRYPNIVPSLQSGRYELGWSAFGEYPAAEQVVDFVTYMSDSTGDVLVAADSKITKATDLCGKSAGMVTGEPSNQFAPIDAACKTAGKPNVSVKMFEKTADIVLALESGQLYARLSDSANGGYIAKTSAGKVKLVTGILPPVKSYTGVIMLKDQKQLELAIQAALEVVVKDGTYTKILAKWGASSDAVSSITLGMP
jgi:polar amino acid transport system substrate-binding protein